MGQIDFNKDAHRDKLLSQEKLEEKLEGLKKIALTGSDKPGEFDLSVENTPQRRAWVDMVELVKRIVITGLGILILVILFHMHKLRREFIFAIAALVGLYWLNLWFNKLKRVPLEGESHLEVKDMKQELKKMQDSRDEEKIRRELSAAQKELDAMEKVIEIPQNAEFSEYQLNSEEKLELSQGEAYLKAGEYHKALEVFERLLQQNAKDARAWLAKAEALKKLGRAEESASASFNAYMLGEKPEYQ